MCPMMAKAGGIKCLSVLLCLHTCFYIPTLYAESNGATESPVIRAPVGKIRGAKRSTPEGIDVYEFLGIRYARPPVGELRYRRPEPEPEWGDEIVDATERPPSCLQRSVFSVRRLIWVPYEERTSEDCLYLNIWTPTINKTANLPVMAWIHGGEFYTGSAAMHVDDGIHLAALGNVVVVTIGYRLQSFGYLYDGTEEAPGNQGLYDQLLALNWIQDNIASFGGDPGEVTAFGWSAGSMSIGFFLTITDTTLPFKRAIMESGPPTNKGQAINSSFALKKSREFGAMFGCDNGDSESDTQYDFVSCMRNVNSSLIVSAEQNFMDGGFTFIPIFGDSLLRNDPEVATFRGDMDILIGQLGHEGSVNLYTSFPDVFSKILPPRNVSKSETVYYLGSFHSSLSLPEILDLQELYMANISDFEYDKIRDALGLEEKDVRIACGQVDTALKLADGTGAAKSGNSVYFYEMSYVSQCSQTQPWLGMSHGDGMFFVFGRPFDSPNGCPEDIPFSTKIIEIWSNFARGRLPPLQRGSPWPQFSRASPQFLEITGSGDRVSRVTYLDRCKALKAMGLY